MVLYVFITTLISKDKIKLSDVRLLHTSGFSVGCKNIKWNRRFKEGQDDVKDDGRSGRSKTQRTCEKARQLERSDRRLST